MPSFLQNLGLKTEASGWASCRLKVGHLEGSGPNMVATSAEEFSQVPFKELSAFQGLDSPYYKESHKKYCLAVRKVVNEVLMPIVEQNNASGEYLDRETRKEMAMRGLLHTKLGPGPWLFPGPLLGPGTRLGLDSGPGLGLGLETPRTRNTERIHCLGGLGHEPLSLSLTCMNK